MEEGGGLGDLMDDIRERGNEAGNKGGAVERWLLPSEEYEGQHSEEGDGIPVKILGPWIVETVEVELKERGGRPNKDGRENGSVTSNECFGSFRCHLIGAIDGLRCDWKERKAGLQLICVSI